MEQGSDPEEDVAGEAGLAHGQPLGHVVDGDVLVDRIRLYMLVEEIESVRTESKPAQALRISAVGNRGSGLKAGQVADDGAAQAPVKPEQRHQVDRGEGDGGNAAQVAAHGR